MQEWLDKIRDGNRRSLAQAMTLVDRGGRRAASLEATLRQQAVHVPWWGITGPPGVGKSTLIEGLIGALRTDGHRVGVVAIDPTSPVTSGAMLGDRIRMMPHALDAGVFIRSLATHGREGGLSDATLGCARLLELAGFDPVLIETVGVGQNEVDVASVADVCLVVLGPGHGDGIQLIKAGLLEIADIVAVNKSDTPEAARVLKEVREELSAAGRDIEIVSVSALSGEGMDDLVARMQDLDKAIRNQKQGEQRAQRRMLSEVKRDAMRAFQRGLSEELARPEVVGLLDAIRRGEQTMDAVVRTLTASVADRQR